MGRFNYGIMSLYVLNTITKSCKCHYLVLYLALHAKVHALNLRKPANACIGSCDACQFLHLLFCFHTVYSWMMCMLNPALLCLICTFWLYNSILTQFLAQFALQSSETKKVRAGRSIAVVEEQVIDSVCT